MRNCLLSHSTLYNPHFTFARRIVFAARKTMSIRSKDDDVKPHDRLVLVS